MKFGKGGFLDALNDVGHVDLCYAEANADAGKILSKLEFAAGDFLQILSDMDHVISI